MRKNSALSDGDFSLAESNAIARYLAVRENSALYGPDLQARAKIDQWMDFIVNHIRSNVGKVQFNRVVAKMFGREGDMAIADEGVAGLMQMLPHVGIDISDFPALQAFLTSAREEAFYTNVHTHFGAEIGK